jgi:hypothetical protein
MLAARDETELPLVLDLLELAAEIIGDGKTSGGLLGSPRSDWYSRIGADIAGCEMRGTYKIRTAYLISGTHRQY